MAAIVAALLLALWPSPPIRAAEAELAGLDARLELIEIAHWLSVRPRLPKVVTHATRKYHEDYEKHFAGMENQAAVLLSGALRPKSVEKKSREALYRARVALGMADTGLPAAQVKRYRDALVAFRHNSKFDVFFKKSAKHYDDEFRVFRDRLKKERYVADIESYTRMPFNGEVRILFSPSLAILGTGYGDTVHIRRPGAPPVIYPYFNTLMLDDLRDAGLPEDIPLYIWHEVGHEIFEPLIEKHQKEIFKKLSDKDGGHYARDIISQAVSIRLFAKRGGEKAAARQLGFEDPPERALLTPLSKKLREYENHPEKYPTFADFFPVLLSALPNP